MLSGITGTFAKDRSPPLSPSPRYVTHALLTCPPLNHQTVTHSMASFDLHALATPPAFVLSQDQTLQFISMLRANHEDPPVGFDGIEPTLSSSTL